MPICFVLQNTLCSVPSSGTEHIFLSFVSQSNILVFFSSFYINLQLLTRLKNKTKQKTNLLLFSPNMKLLSFLFLLLFIYLFSSRRAKTVLQKVVFLCFHPPQHRSPAHPAKFLYLLSEVFVLRCQHKHLRHYTFCLLYPGEQTPAAYDIQILGLMECCHLKELNTQRLFHFF